MNVTRPQLYLVPRALFVETQQAGAAYRKEPERTWKDAAFRVFFCFSLIAVFATLVAALLFVN